MNGQIYGLRRDHQRSHTGLMDQEGKFVVDYRFDAWGRQRDPITWMPYACGNEPALMFDRGYTGHEHLTEFGLINMNGRAYDPFVGQFLSPDPFISDASNPQCFNRYAYCRNNPLKYTDPSGYFDWKWFVDQNISSAKLDYMSYMSYDRHYDTELSWQQSDAVNKIVAYRNAESKYETINYNGGGLLGEGGYFSNNNDPMFMETGGDKPKKPWKKTHRIWDFPLLNDLLQNHLSGRGPGGKNNQGYRKIEAFETNIRIGWRWHTVKHIPIDHLSEDWDYPYTNENPFRFYIGSGVSEQKPGQLMSAILIRNGAPGSSQIEGDEVFIYNQYFYFEGGESFHLFIQPNGNIVNDFNFEIQTQKEVTIPIRYIWFARRKRN